MTERNYLLAAGTPILLAEPSATLAAASAPPNRLAEWRGPARPIEVALYAEKESEVYAFPTTSFPGYAGTGTTNPPLPAYFEIEYGCGGIVRRRIVDLVTARVFLGTCDYVSVNARRWRDTVSWGVMQFTLQVTASIAESGGGSYDELQATQMVRATQAVALSTNFRAPSGAYAWQAGITAAPLTSVVWGTAQPDIYFMGGGEEVVYRLATYQIVPSFRRYKPPFNGSLNVNSNLIALGAVDLAIIVTWFMNS